MQCFLCKKLQIIQNPFFKKSRSYFSCQTTEVFQFSQPNPTNQLFSFIPSRFPEAVRHLRTRSATESLADSGVSGLLAVFPHTPKSDTPRGFAQLWRAALQLRVSRRAAKPPAHTATRSPNFLQAAAWAFSFLISGWVDQSWFFWSRCCIKGRFVEEKKMLFSYISKLNAQN